MTADVIVAGAGLAGLLAARALGAAGLRVLVLDEGPRPGGRLATRRVGGGLADAGAQFFTVRSAEFAGVVEGWLAEGRVFEWSRGWSDGSLAATAPDGYPRYAARGGFGALAAYLAEGLDVRPATKVLAAMPQAAGWRVHTAAAQEYTARGLLLAMPAPEALRLLDTGAVPLPAAERQALESIGFAPCLCGLFEVAGGTHLPEPGALQRPDAPVSWLADNRRKGVSPAARILTVHAGPAASLAHWDEDDAAVLAWLGEAARPYLSEGAVVGQAELVRWPYAIPLTVHSERCLASRLAVPLLFAGDAYGGPRVEGAALSGWAAAEALLARL